MMLMKRRDFLKLGAAAGSMAALYGCAAGGNKASGHVVVVGGGYGGATLAKYLRMWSEGGVQVTLIERNPTFISCPMSNLVIGGFKTMEDITVSYDNLKNKWQVRVIQDEVVAVDAAKRSISLAKGGSMTYDRLVLSPGVDFMFDQIPGLNNAVAQSTILHAWKAGPQTVALAQTTGGHEGWRGLRDLDSEGAVPLPAGAIRARLPGRQLLQAAQAEIEGDHSRCQRGGGIEERLVHQGVV